MYAVVGCGECEALWIVADRPATTTCPRCDTRHEFASLRRLAETETQPAARRARTRLLAARADTGTLPEGVDAADADAGEFGTHD